MASRDNHLLKSYIQSRESLNICVIMTNNKGKKIQNCFLETESLWNNAKGLCAPLKMSMKIIWRLLKL